MSLSNVVMEESGIDSSFFVGRKMTLSFGVVKVSSHIVEAYSGSFSVRMSWWLRKRCVTLVFGVSS